MSQNHPPFRRLLTVTVLSTTSFALLLACALVVAYQWFEFRKATTHEMTVVGDILAANSQSAITFQDENSAAQTLQALRAEHQVTAACLYDGNGRMFAEYSATEHTQFPQVAGTDGYRFDTQGIELYRPVILDGKRIGTLYLNATLNEFYSRLRVFAGIVVLILAGSLLAAYAMARRMQKPVLAPILALAGTAKKISESNDYGVRAIAEGSLELVQLTDAFNGMLSTIQQREAALASVNESLSGEMAERERADARVHDQLARMELLHRITRAISERQDIRSIFQVVLRTLEDRLPLDFCCVCVLDEGATSLTVTSVGARGEEASTELVREKARFGASEGGLSTAVKGTLIFEPDISRSSDRFPSILAKHGLRSLVLSPLLVESHIFGIIASARKEASAFSSGECEFLKQLSEHVALAAHQAQLHEALQQAYDDLRQTQQAVMQQERLKALGQMASGIAHDINNAISPAALYTESLLETETGVSARGRDYLTTIQRALDDVAQTVARMREFYRQKESEMTFSPVPLNRLVKEVLELSRARWHDMPQQKGVMIHIETELEEGLPPILGVESEIREALVNLVFNAVDAMPEGGTLTMCTGTQDGKAQGESDLASVYVGVRDTGVGMDEDTQRRCLEPFYTTKGERGTGLGLAMVYGTMRRHAGEIDIESAIGRGTTFKLLFQKPDASSLTPQASPKVFTLLTRLRVLVIDDDPLLIKSLRDILETDGHVVTTANGGQAGIEAFRTSLDEARPFAVVITDLGMPYVDGRRVASAIRALSAATPIILLTGWGQRLVAEGDVPAHVNLVLNKPPKLRALREAIATCVTLPKP